MPIHKGVVNERFFISPYCIKLNTLDQKKRRKKTTSMCGHYDWLSSEPKHNERHESWLGRALSWILCPLNASEYRCFKKDGSFARLTPDDDDDYGCRWPYCFYTASKHMVTEGSGLSLQFIADGVLLSWHTHTHISHICNGILYLLRHNSSRQTADSACRRVCQDLLRLLHSIHGQRFCTIPDDGSKDSYRNVLYW